MARKFVATTEQVEVSGRAFTIREMTLAEVDAYFSLLVEMASLSGVRLSDPNFRDAIDQQAELNHRMYETIFGEKLEPEFVAGLTPSQEKFVREAFDEVNSVALEQIEGRISRLQAMVEAVG